MPKRSSIAVACAVAGGLIFSQRALVPAPKVSRAPISAIAGSVAALGAAPAFADEIGEAAQKLSLKSYPFLKEIDWNSYIFGIKPPGDAGPIAWLKAIDKAILMGAEMDSQLLKQAVLVHSNAIKNADANGMISLADYASINAAIGRIVASCPESVVMDVYNAFDAVLPKTIAPYLMSRVKAADAKASYDAFLEFKDVVKTHPIQPGAVGEPSVNAEKLSRIGDAALTLTDGSYKFMKEVDWTSDLFLKPLPGATAQKALKAVDKALMMGATMDPKLLKEAAMAHHKAIGGIDASTGVLKEADYTAINSAIGKLIASVPQSRTIDVFNSFKEITVPEVSNNLFASVNAADAVSAYSAFWQFKDVVAR